MTLRAAALAAALMSAGCPAGRVIPGDEVIGAFGFTARDAGRECDLDEVSSDDFAFEATLSRQSGSALAWVTLERYSRDGGWDGQYFESTGVAQRVFVACNECPTSVEETMRLAILSRSQSDALGGACPLDALDGGVPGPDAGAGVTPPGMTPLGFDAERACGALSVAVTAGPKADGGACAAACNGCRVRFTLEGVRR